MYLAKPSLLNSMTMVYNQEGIYTHRQQMSTLFLGKWDSKTNGERKASNSVLQAFNTCISAVFNFH